MLASKPLVSIGMPIYNGMRPTFISKINFEKSLKSILKQSYKNLEIIISDNCSSDETINVIKKYLKKDKRIIFFKQKKKIHFVDNFRFVLKNSSGEYFKFNAHDDLISKNFIEKNLNFLIKNKSYIFSSSPLSFECSKKKKYLKIKSLDGDVYNRIKIFLKNAVYSQHCFNALFKKEYLKDCIFGYGKNCRKFNKNIFCLDWLNTVQMLISGKFQTIKQGRLVIGVNGNSNQINYIKQQINLVSKNKFGRLIRYIFPVIDFNLAFFKTINNLNDISKLKKMHLNVLSLSYNWFFLKAIIKKIILKIK